MLGRMLRLSAVFLFLLLNGSPPHARAAELRALPDTVDGNLIEFNDNGAWTWYSDERAVVDTSRRELIIGSVACEAGTGGEARAGDVECVIRSEERRVGKEGGWEAGV